MAERPRLLDRVRAEIRAQHYRRRTEEADVHWIRRYILFHGKRHPTTLSADEITAFLTSLAIEKSVAASTQNQAFSALMFLYREVLQQDLGSVEPAPRAKGPSFAATLSQPTLASSHGPRRRTSIASTACGRRPMMRR